MMTRNQVISEILNEDAKLVRLNQGSPQMYLEYPDGNKVIYYFRQSNWLSLGNLGFKCVESEKGIEIKKIN